MQGIMSSAKKGAAAAGKPKPLGAAGDLMSDLKGGVKDGLMGLAGKFKGLASGAMPGAGATEGGGRRTLADLLMKFVEWLVKLLMLVVNVFRMLPAIWMSLWALVCIVVFLLLICLCIYFVFVSNPRMPLLWHSEKFDDYMTAYKADLLSCMDDLSGNHGAVAGMLSAVPGVAPGAVDAVQQHLNAVLAYDASPMDANLDVYLQFRGAISGFGFLAKRDLRSNARQFVTDEDELDCDDFRGSFLQPMDDFARAVDALSSQLEARGARLLRGHDVRVPGPGTTDSSGNVTVAYDVFPGEASLEPGPIARKYVTTSRDGQRVLRTRSVDLATSKASSSSPDGQDDGQDEEGGKGMSQVVAYVTALHKVRMMMEQRESIEVMHKSRRKKLPFAIWTIYYAPMIKNLFFSFAAYWKKFPKRAIKTFMGTINWWMSLGPFIAVMPCKMAYTDPKERAERCHATMVDRFVPEPATHDEFGNERSADTQTREVVEGMFDLGGIISAMSSIASFFMNIASIGMALGELMAGFPADPFGTIIRILAILLGTIIGFVVMNVWILLTVMMWPLLLAWSAFVFWCLWCGWWYSVWLVFLALLLAIPYFGLWLIDMPTGGFVTRMMHCENSPGDWHSRNMVSDDNTFVRYFPFCMRPCASRYTKSWSGCCCNRLPKYMPDLCPQQQIFNLSQASADQAPGSSAASFAHKGPVAFAHLAPDAAFKRLTVDAKRRYLVSAFKRKASWYKRCYDALDNKDYLNRHLCSVFDQLGLDAATTKKLAVVCSECYCDYQRNPDEDSQLSSGNARMTPTGFQPQAPNGGNESLCRELKRSAAGVDDDPGDPGPGLLRRVVVMTLIALVGLLALYSMARSGDKLLK